MFFAAFNDIITSNALASAELKPSIGLYKLNNAAELQLKPGWTSYRSDTRRDEHDGINLGIRIAVCERIDEEVRGRE